jgi:two-component system, OmpR family, sensor histidine kinase KdpD
VSRGADRSRSADGRLGRPEDFLDILRRAKRGRLKLYIGFAAGVGKTYRMLEEAHALAGRGVDVVLGFIETHGRAETARLLDGLEELPHRKLQYRGVELEEMDLEGLIERRPEITIVDEIAHTNVPGNRNRRRYQDVLALLDAGIHVIGAFNIQHLESLSDVVQRVTGVTIRETVPDSFLDRADQVVNLDLAVEDLIERLQGGKIYAADKVPWALEHFFQERHLATLRELALREVAESLDRGGRPRQRAGGPPDAETSRAGAVSGRVMVCMSSLPTRASALLRRGSRMAGRLNTDWFVVYVETPREALHLIDAEAQRHLLANADRARELGAEVVHLKSDDPATALLDFARSHGVGQIVVGRSRAPWWRQVFGQSTTVRLIRESVGFDVLIASLEDEAAR